MSTTKPSRAEPGERGSPAAGGMPQTGLPARLRARAEIAAARYQVLAERHPLLSLPLSFVVRYIGRQGLLLASAIAFRMFLWLLPLMLLVTGIVVGVTGGDPQQLESVTETSGVTGATSREIVTALAEGHRSWWVAVMIGAGAFLWTTRTLIRSLVVVSAHAWGVTRPKQTLRELLSTTLVFAACWFAVFAVAAVIVRLDHVIFVGPLIATLIQGVAVSGAWLVISLRLPDGRSSWLDLVPGCVLFGFGMAFLHAASRLYIPGRLERSSELYGALGVAGVILAWLLIIGNLVVGAMLANSLWSEYLAGHRSLAQIGRPPT